MRLSHVSIDRPVLTLVLSVFIMVLGLISIPFLGVREFPAVDPPRITVTTNYPGADAEVIESQITEPLEESVNGVDGIRSLTSVSREGRSSITVEFDLSSDLNAAANDVRDRVSRAQRRLPLDAEPPTVSKADANSFPVILMTLESPSRNILDVTAAGERVKERLQTISGVAEVRIWGEKRYAMRLRLDPERLAAHNLTATDVRTVLATENVELPSGRIEGANVELTVKTRGQLRGVEEFNNLVLRADGRRLVRFADVGTAVLGAENERSILKRDGVPMIGLAIVAQPGANSVSIGNEFLKRFEQIRAELPPDLKARIGFDNTQFVRRSLLEVAETIAIAFVLVFLVLFFFLRNWRTALIPLLAIPVSLVGALFLLYAADFSINVLTLLGLVLAIGLVVDDAIVVMENIYQKIEDGEEPRAAGYKGLEEIFFAVISTTLALAVVFMPLLFIEGFVGRLFREFGLAVAGAVLLSSVVSLTLTPMLSTRLLRRKHSRLYDRTEPFFAGLVNFYARSLRAVIHRRVAAILVVIAAGGGAYALIVGLKSELAPMEDRSQINLNVTGAEGLTFAYMDRFMDRLAETVREVVPEFEGTLAVTSPGFGASGGVNTGFVRVFLPEPAHRIRSQSEIADALSVAVRRLTDARTVVVQSQTIQSGGGGFGLPVQFVIQAPNLDSLIAVLPRFLEEARKEPAFAIVDENLKFTRPEIRVEVDRDRLRAQGVPFRDVAQALQLSLGESNLGYFLKDGRQYAVIAHAAEPYRDEPSDVGNIAVRAADGALIPLSNLVTIREQAGPPQLFRYNRWVAATVSASLAPGATMGEGVEAMRRVAGKVLDPSFNTDLSGAARDFAESSSSLLFTFFLALLLVYLVLAAQFESFRHPFVILLTVPLSLFGALLALFLFGQTLNIFSQIGLVMLVGLVTKNGILIVEFSRQKHEQGLALAEAVVVAAQSRLRPILMTTFTSALGMLPIALALGAGSESRRPMGIAVVGGLLFGMVLTLYVIPAMILLFAPKKDREVKHA
jgi:multidrug efflux pump